MIAANGVISSMMDLRAGRETLAGPANEFHLLRDHPNRWSAWDIEASAMEDYEIVGNDGQGRLLENGPLRVVLEFVRAFGKSTITQRVILTAGSARLERLVIAALPR